MLDWEKTRAFPSLRACLDPRREKYPGSREEDAVFALLLRGTSAGNALGYIRFQLPTKPG
jgi:hypothetical protein